MFDDNHDAEEEESMDDNVPYDDEFSEMESTSDEDDQNTELDIDEPQVSLQNVVFFFLVLLCTLILKAFFELN